MLNLGRYVPGSVGFSTSQAQNVDTGTNLEYIRVINNSPYLLSLDLKGLGKIDFPENYLEDIYVAGRGFLGKLEMLPVQNFSATAISNALSNLVSINGYNHGELHAPQAQPLTTLANVGNGVVTAQLLQSLNNLTVSQIINASEGQVGVQVFIASMNDDGSAAFGSSFPAIAQVLWDHFGNLTAQTGKFLGGGITISAPPALGSGFQETGQGAVGNNNGITSANPNIAGVNPKTIWHAAPSSITFTTDASTNVNAPFASDLSVNGFGLAATQPANGFSRWLGSWVTVGL